MPFSFGASLAVMQRYFLQISYCGRRFRGLQKSKNEGVIEAATSVQGHLEEGLRRLYPDNLPSTSFSSRTDKGVHAFNNTLHVDLRHRKTGHFFDVHTITNHLNGYFSKKDVDIRVKKTLVVPPLFHARSNIVSRSYLYRLGVLKPGVHENREVNFMVYFPLGEIHKLYSVRQPFDIEKFKAGCQLLEGIHDFASFMAPNGYVKDGDPTRTVRKIDSITITEGRPLFNPLHEPLYENFDIWDVNISSRAFLYKQIRRIVGALVAVAQGRISLDDIQHLLDKPATKNWISKAVVAPAYGLYLLEVKYLPEAFEESFFLDRSSEDNKSSSEKEVKCE